MEWRINWGEQSHKLKFQDPSVAFISCSHAIHTMWTVVMA
jgi:hypothetical protein